MNLKVTNSYTLITPDEKTLVEFINLFEKNYNSTSKEHVIINFSENFNIEAPEIKLFLDIANSFRENGTSFVLIVNDIDIDAIPDEINVVPTFEEAIDILEIDAIERDLLG